MGKISLKFLVAASVFFILFFVSLYFHIEFHEAYWMHGIEAEDYKVKAISQFKEIATFITTLLLGVGTLVCGVIGFAVWGEK